jgi:hypothetical protein
MLRDKKGRSGKTQWPCSVRPAQRNAFIVTHESTSDDIAKMRCDSSFSLAQAFTPRETRPEDILLFFQPPSGGAIGQDANHRPLKGAERERNISLSFPRRERPGLVKRNVSRDASAIPILSICE